MIVCPMEVKVSKIIYFRVVQAWVLGDIPQIQHAPADFEQHFLDTEIQ